MHRFRFFWSDQLDQRIQFLGRSAPDDEVVVGAGSVADGKLLALYGRNGKLHGAFGLNAPRWVMPMRKLLLEQVSFDDASGPTRPRSNDAQLDALSAPEIWSLSRNSARPVARTSSSCADPIICTISVNTMSRTGPLASSLNRAMAARSSLLGALSECGLLGNRFGLSPDVVRQRDGRRDDEFADVTQMALLAAASTAQHWPPRLDLANRLAEQQAMPGNVEPLMQALEAALRAVAAKRFALR